MIDSTTAYMITDMLSDVIKRGTARRAKASFSNVAIAGKPALRVTAGLLVTRPIWCARFGWVWMITNNSE